MRDARFESFYANMRYRPEVKKCGHCEMAVSTQSSNCPCCKLRLRSRARRPHYERGTRCA